MPVKVIYLITELNIGGAQTVLLRFLTHLDRNRFTPCVICLYNGDAPIAQAIRSLNIEVIDLRVHHKADLTSLLRLYNLLVQKQPTILHTHLFHVNLPGRILGRLAGVPIIINSEHNMAMEPEWRYRVNAWTSSLVDRVTTISEAIHQFSLQHIGLPAKKVVVIYDGVELNHSSRFTRQQARQSLGLPLEGLVLGAVSRFDPVKGLAFLIQAFAQLKNQANLQLVLVGDGPERPTLESLAQDLGIIDRVYWPGFRTDILDLLPAFDIFIQPSIFEGLSMSILEAMAACLPVVATNVGGIPEIVSDGITGCLVPPRDPAALAQAIQTLINQPELRDRMGQAGLERVRQEFSVQQMVKRTEALYEELLTTLKPSTR